MTNLNLNQFDFNIPDHLIAQTPLKKRDQSKLLHFDRKKNNISHALFSDLPNHLPKNSVLVFNNTKVLKARVVAHRKTGAKIECFFLEKLKKNRWKTLLKNGQKVKCNDHLLVKDHEIKIIEKSEKIAVVEIIGKLSDYDFLNSFGDTPLPPYIKSKDPNQHHNRYQTVFASSPGAVAAPTASLHFTPELLTQLKKNKIDIIYITLHIGLGTFNPIQSKNIYDHTMHKENYYISQETATKLNAAKKQKKPIIAVGTTVVRCLESNIKNNAFTEGKNSTNLFITPQHKFESIHGMITNFHLPKSSLLILVASFIGKDTVLNLYNTAVNHRYRFFSFGDAMLIT